MDAPGAIVAAAMFGPPVASFIVLRRAGRTRLKAIWGAALIWAGSTVLAVSAVAVAEQHGVPITRALLVYAALVIAFAIVFYRHHSRQ